MRHDKRYEDLDSLGDWELEHKSQDIRGRPLVSSQGQKYGVIDDLLVDRAAERVAAVRLEDGRVCAIEPLEIHEDVVVYGEAAHAHADAAGIAKDTKKEGVIKEERIPVVEEKVAIGKRVSEHGKNINVRTRVVTDKVGEDVRLRDEHVSVERRPVDRKLKPGEAEGLMKDRNVSMTERDEEVVVGKEAVVTDEVVVKKTADERVEHVEETVRKTEVDVDKGADTRRR